jgi:hypothetical protein
MRYIKLFESFNDRDKLKENIAACLVELYDKGFEITTVINDSYINIEISKKGSDEEIEGDPAFYQGYDSFELDEIEDEIIQVSDYVSETYDIDTEYIPETRWDNVLYTNLKDIPDGLDLIRFDVYFYFNKTNENYEQEPDKDWSVISKGSSKVNRFHFDTGFLSDEEALKERVRNIFIELEDTDHDVTIDIDKLGIGVNIEASEKMVRAGTAFSDINDELNEYSIDYDLTKECCETFVEYIKERNPNVDSRLGLNTKYTIEYYIIDKSTGIKDWKREYLHVFPSPWIKNKITKLKITLSV